MGELKVRNISQQLLNSIDEIVKQKGYSDRGALVRDVLEKYVQFGDAFLVKKLPETVKLLVAESLKEYPEKLSNMLQFQLELSQRNVSLLNEINSYFTGDINSDID